MEEEYEVDDLGVPILDDLGVPKLKVKANQPEWREQADAPKTLNEKFVDFTRGAVDYAAAGVGGINRGLTQIISEPLKFLGALNTIGETVESPNYALQAGQAITDFTNKINPVNPEVNQTFQDVSQGLGQAGGMMATMGLSASSAAPQLANAATGLLPATGRALGQLGQTAISPTGFVAGSMVAAPEWEAAKQAGLSDDEAIGVLAKNYFVGQTEILPFQNVLSRLNRIGGGRLAEILKNVGMGGFEEAVQEATQTYLTNEIAKGTYDPERDPLFQVLQSAKVGGLVGMLLPAIGSVAAPQAIRQKLDQKVVELQTNQEIADNTSGDPQANQEIDTVTDAFAANPDVSQPVQETQAFTESEQPVKREQTLGSQLLEAEGEVAEVEQAPQIEADPIQAADEFNKSRFLTDSGKEAVTQIADFARDKFTKKSQFFSFVETFNEQSERKISEKEADQTWQQIREVKVKEPQETVTMTINDALKKQIKDFYRGVDKGVKKGQELVNTNLIPKVQEALKTSNLTPNQTNAILGKLRRTNLFAPGSYSKLQSYIDNVVAKADYAAQEQQGLDLKAKIKSQTKNKAIPQNIRGVSQDFIKLDPDSFEINDYLQLAEHVSNNLTSPKGNKYTGFDALKVNEVINKQKEKQEKEQIRKELGDLTDEEVDELIEKGESIDEYLANAGETKRKQTLDRLRIKADYAKIGLESVDPTVAQNDSERAALNQFLNADTSKMTADDMVNFIRIADNVTLNEDFSGSDVLSAKLEAAKNMEFLANKQPTTPRGEIGGITKELYSLGQVLDVAFNNSKFVGDFEAMTGISEILEAGSFTSNESLQKANELQELITSVNKKYKKPDIRNQDQQFKLNLLGILARTSDGTSHLAKVKSNLRQTVKLYQKKDAKIGTEVAKIVEQYIGKPPKEGEPDVAKINSSDEAIEAFKKQDPHVYETWKWFQDEVFTPEFTNATKRNTNNLYNKSFIPEQNYWPYSQTRIDSSTPDVNDKMVPAALTLKPQQSSNTLKATRSLALGHAYSLDAFGPALRAYRNTLYDQKSGRAIQLLHESTKRPEFEGLVGGLENKSKIISTLRNRLAEQYGVTEHEGDFIRALNDILHVFKDLGTAKALGGLDQIISQSVPTWVASSINLGKDANLMFATIPQDFYENVIGVKTRVSEAGRRRGGTDLGDTAKKYLSEESEKAYVRSLDNLRRGTSKIAGWKLTFLTKGDVMVRQRAFTAFYIKRLRELGVDPKEIDLNTESQKQSDPLRKRARAYADNQVSNLQVPSNRAEMSELLTKKGGWDTIRTIVFPFSTFPLNTKIRLARAAKKIKVNPEEGSKEMAGVLAESVVFAGIKAYLLAGVYYPMIQALYRAMFGLETPEDEEGNSEFWDQVYNRWGSPKTLQKITTNLVNDVSPVSLGIGQTANSYMVNHGGYFLRGEEYQDYTFDEWMAETKGIITPPYQNDFSSWGVIGVGGQQLYDIGKSATDATQTMMGAESIYYDTYFGSQEADTEGIEDLIYLNAIFEVAGVAAPREANNAWKKVYKEQLEGAGRTNK